MATLIVVFASECFDNNVFADSKTILGQKNHVMVYDLNERYEPFSISFGRVYTKNNKNLISSINNNELIKPRLNSNLNLRLKSISTNKRDKQNLLGKLDRIKEEKEKPKNYILNILEIDENKD